MALVRLSPGGVVNSTDPNQYADLLTGAMTDQPVTVGNRIRAQLAGAVSGSGGYVGHTGSGSPVTGTFAVGDFCTDGVGRMWICISAGSPGLWVTSTPTTAAVATSQGTGSTSFTDLATVGPSVPVTTGTTALVTLTAVCNCSVSDGVYAGFAVSGASTVAASTDQALTMIGTSAVSLSATYQVTGLTSGLNVVTMKFRSAFSGTATFRARSLTVVAA